MKYVVLPTLIKLSAFDLTKKLTAQFIHTPYETQKSHYSTKPSATFDVTPYKLHKLDSGPALQSELIGKDALKYLEIMSGMRRLETVTAELYKSKFIRGFCHMYSGQEAVGTGILACLRKQDSLITSYRCHIFPYLMGWGAVGVFAELMGRKTGCSRGKGGSMHMYATNFYGGNGIVGAQVPLGTGMGLAHMYKGDGGVSFTLYGDGAANQGQTFEAYNIAMLKKLPVVYVCENNLYAMGTATHRAAASTAFYTRGDYIPGVLVDGMDVLAVKEAVKFAIEHATSGKGPIILEMSTYRYYGHSMSDPGISYRPREEVQEVRKTKDPINTFKAKILKAEIVTADEVKAIEEKAKKEMNAAADQAKKEPIPALEELAADVYGNCVHPNQVMRGVVPSNMLKHFNTGHKLPTTA